MANGTIWLYSNNSKLEGKIDWWSSSNGSISNSSNVDATLYVRRNDGYVTKGTWTGNISVGDKEISFSNPSTSVGTDWVGMGSIYGKVIYHANDGSGSVWIHGECNAPSGTSLAGAVVGGSQTVGLDRIPRGSTIGTPSLVNLEDSFSVPTTRYVGYDRLDMKLGGTLIMRRDNYGSNSSIRLSDTELLTAYNAMGSNMTSTFTFELRTYDSTSYSNQIGNTSSTNRNGTSAGTAFINAGGTWKRSLPFVNVNGTWKKCIAFMNVSGTWKRGV